ncbi:MAG: aminotransferase class I/II-fold pyridoxal phosphate-dependent enzyme [Ignavibacterium sp.]|nr:MAG: aminotransferase class I/II-fold pyridoxal phosphate-dependent enzyme [Ignavibacterium sp.]
MEINEAKSIQKVEEYYFSTKLKEISDIEKTREKVINLGIGNPDLPPSQSTIDALKDSAMQSGNHGYQSYNASFELREAISKHYKDTYGVKIDTENELLPLRGSKEGIMIISMAFLNPGDVVLVPNPGYPTYAAATRMLNAELEYYDLIEENDWQIDIEDLKNRDLSKLKIMWVNYPHMPTGAVASISLFNELINLAKQNDFLLCNDNPYSLVLNKYPISFLSANGATDVGLELNSLSKSHNMAGWRMGWLAGNQRYIKSALKVKSNIDSGIFLPIQHAAIEALKNSNEWHKERNEEMHRRREKVFSLLNQLDCNYDKKQVGMFVWAKLPDIGIDTKTFVDKILHQARVFITPGFVFGSNGDGYVRVSLSSSVQKIEEAIQRIRKNFHIEKEIK